MNILTYVKQALIVVFIIVVGVAAYHLVAHGTPFSVVDGLMVLCLVQLVR